MANFLIEKLFDNVPCVIVLDPDLDKLLQTEILPAMLERGYKDQLVYLDLLLRNGAGDRFFTITMENGEWKYSSCKAAVLTEEQFIATCHFYKKNPELFDQGCSDVLSDAQKFLMKRGSTEQLYRNYCYFERQRCKS